jgi:hypothetical protein
VLLVLLVLVAAAVGAVSGFVHRTTVDVAGAKVPIGLVASLGGLAAVVMLARLFGNGRASVLVVAAAYAIPVLVLSQFRPEGDLVVAEDAWGLSLLGGSALVITLAVAVPFSSYDEAQTAAPGVSAPTPSEQT